jgi:Tfp pilus assembly PilM family ATPase
MVESFFDFFPAPKFLEMPSPGLSLSDAGVRFIEFGEEKHGLILKDFGEASFSPDFMVGGKIENSQGLITALTDFRKEKNIHYIRTTLPDERAYLYTTDVPNVNEKEMRTAVEFTLEENVPLSVSEVVFDYNILAPKEGVVLKKDTTRVSVSVLPRDVVSEYLNVFQAAGFTPLHFEIESQSVAKAIVPRGNKGTFLLLNIGKIKTSVSIVSDWEVSFTSTVSTSEDLATAFEEIKKITVYWQTQADRRNEIAEPFEKIFLCGEGAARPDLATIVSGKTGIRAQVADVWVNVFSLKDYIPDITLEKSLGYASAIGLALKHRKK